MPGTLRYVSLRPPKSTILCISPRRLHPHRIQTRLQVMSSSPIRSHSGILRSLRSIKRADGIRSLWRGLPSVVVGAGSSQSSYNEGTSLTTSHRSGSCDLLRSLRNRQGSPGWERQDQTSSFCCWYGYLILIVLRTSVNETIATSGACATIASDAFMNPFDGLLPHIRILKLF